MSSLIEKGRKGVRVLDTRIEDVDPSAKVIVGERVGDKEVENKLELPVIWVVAPKSMARLIENVRRQ